MRLWHYKLIPVLPNKMLVSQWRECIVIKRQWEKGTLKHRLVSYVMDYNKLYFWDYVKRIVYQMEQRGIKYQQKYYDEFVDWCEVHSYIMRPDILNYPEHNDRYLKQCLYNLEEKYDRGIITKDEYEKIIKKQYEEIFEKVKW